MTLVEDAVRTIDTAQKQLKRDIAMGLAELKHETAASFADVFARLDQQSAKISAVDQKVDALAREVAHVNRKVDALALEV